MSHDAGQDRPEGWDALVGAFRAADGALRDLEARRAASIVTEAPTAVMGRYLDLRAALPHPEDARDAAMREFHPDLASEAASIEVAGREHVRARLAAGRVASTALESALDALGTHLGRRAALDVTLPAPEAMRRGMETGSRIRRSDLDGKRLSFDERGPFTLALHRALAVSKGIRTSKAGWLGHVIAGLAQPVHLVGEADMTGVMAISEILAATPRGIVTEGIGQDGARRVRAVVTTDALGSLTRYLERTTHVMDARLLVRDPHFKGDVPEGPRPEVTDLDDAELAGELAHLSWRAATEAHVDARLSDALAKAEEETASRALLSEFSP